jgi:hypothetical protein
MKNFLLRLGAIALALFLGGSLNMFIVGISGSVIPPPPGADFTTAEDLQQSAHLMEPRHFIMPFLAHALGTLLAGFVAAALTRERKWPAALIPGLVFLTGGIMAVQMIPAPMWFNILDLVVAYVPMAWAGYRVQQKMFAN